MGKVQEERRKVFSSSLETYDHLKGVLSMNVKNQQEINMDLTNRDEEYIYSDPKGCDECSDIYNIKDLYLVDGEDKCKNCLEFK